MTFVLVSLYVDNPYVVYAHIDHLLQSVYLSGQQAAGDKWCGLWSTGNVLGW